MAKSVIIAVRMSEEMAEAIDASRGGQSRSAWVVAAIDEVLAAGNERAPQPQEKRRDPGRCPHPRARVIKGFCYACGKPATI